MDARKSQRTVFGESMTNPTSVKFKCPKCGGSSFGSVMSDPNPAGPVHRYCHGNDAHDGHSGCMFEWWDADDWKYFLVDGAKLGRAAFKKTMKEIMETPIEGLP